MNNEFKRLNEKYNDDTYETFPYISPFRITPLRRGLYKKHNAKYRGITAKYDEEQGKFRFFLYGMYRIKEDLVIVPEGLELNDGKRVLLEAAVKSGFIKVTRPPKFDPIEFAEDSPEARMALANKASFHSSKGHDSMSNNNNTTL